MKLTIKQIGMIVQGVGIAITAISAILLIRLQPVPAVSIVIGIVMFLAGHFIRRIEG